MSKRLSPFSGALLAALTFIAAPVEAHDFWMEVSPWRVAPGVATAPELHIGHIADRILWSGAPDRIVRVTSISASGAKDVRDALTYDAAKKIWGGAVAFDAPGVHVLALETNDAFSVLSPEKFDAYVEEEGLTPARRARGAASLAPGRERYSRRAKTLVFVEGGARDALPPLAGHTLEIAPLDSPFALTGEEPLRLRVFYEGAPLNGASVKLESLSVAAAPMRRALTDGDGRVDFALPKRGAWKASVVWTKPLKGDPKADFETVFASLAFSFESD